MAKKESGPVNRRLAFSLAFILAGIIVPCVAGLKHVEANGSPTAQTQGERNQEPGKRMGFRLRSFVPNAVGSLYFEPTVSGGRVRLTAVGLPAPEALMPDTHSYVVWAVAAGEKPLRVGELRIDSNGNGGIEFARPASFERYSVVVTAERSAAAESPAGVMIFASRAGAVTAFYGEKNNKLTEARKKSLDRELGRRTGAARGANDFYAEVDNALKASAGGPRTLELYGDEVAPNAHGLALVAARSENIYVRTLIRRLPLPSQVGANAFVLWGIIPDGRITYMGSLPAIDVNDSDSYVRVGGFTSADLDLMVTAEMRRPVSRPSARRTLSTRTPQPEGGPAFGAIEGRVLDAEGKPLARATVDIRPVDQTVAGSLPVAQTDEQGRFFLDGVPPGMHMVYASKEEEGYPATYMAFFVTDSASIPKVTVTNRQVTEDVVVRLGPKAARLVGRIVDAKTHQPIEEAEIILYREDNPNDYFSFGLNQEGGRFQRLIPSTSLRMKVSAPGYEDWYYGKDGSKELWETVQVAPNATKEITIALRPAKRG